MQGNGNHRKLERSEKRPHEEFLELCALSTTGELSADEQRKLGGHLASCPECREALKEFETVAQVAVPLLAENLAQREPADPTPVSIAPEEEIALGKEESAHDFTYLRQNGNGGTHINWIYVWVPFAAAVVLTVSLGIYSYQVGKSRGIEVAQKSGRPDAESGIDTRIDALEQQLSDAGHEREVLRAQIEERDRIIQTLRREVTEESKSLGEAKNLQDNLAKSVQAEQVRGEDTAQQAAHEAASLREKLDATATSLQELQRNLASVEREREQGEARAGSLEAQVRDLEGQLKQQETEMSRQQDLLADDRDIRDLMGARDLYIAEVYDVSREGATEKPYGRVFYTKGKSLIFYAYDLDQQTGIKSADTFQAWGQSGPDRKEALNLGIFYLDNAAKKRWILKFDDAHALEQINAVFVTVEPRGGSHKPDGKPLLFASLRIEPNHP